MDKFWNLSKVKTLDKELQKFYENRVNEIMDRFLKNIKECDQDPNKKKLWEPFDQAHVLEHDDIRDIV